MMDKEPKYVVGDIIKIGILPKNSYYALITKVTKKMYKWVYLDNGQTDTESIKVADNSERVTLAA
jgi:hypothetical protein